MSARALGCSLPTEDQTMALPALASQRPRPAPTDQSVGVLEGEGILGVQTWTYCPSWRWISLKSR
jgi:hypothetical protein